MLLKVCVEWGVEGVWGGEIRGGEGRRQVGGCRTHSGFILLHQWVILMAMSSSSLGSFSWDNSFRAAPNRHMKELLIALSERKVSRMVSGAAIVSQTIPHSRSGSSTLEKAAK